MSRLTGALFSIEKPEMVLTNGAGGIVRRNRVFRIWYAPFEYRCLHVAAYVGKQSRIIIGEASFGITNFSTS